MDMNLRTSRLHLKCFFLTGERKLLVERKRGKAYKTWNKTEPIHKKIQKYKKMKEA